MKHIRQFESYRNRKHREEIIRESVLQVNDIYKVKAMIDIPKSLINSYVKKVKEIGGQDLRQFFGDYDLAEEIVKYITLNNLDADKIPANALMGGPAQAQAPQAQTQQAPQAQTQQAPEAQAAPAPEAQAAPAPEAQAATAPEAQAPQVQVQTQTEGGENVGEFEEPNVQTEKEKEEEGEEELPL